MCRSVFYRCFGVVGGLLVAALLLACDPAEQSILHAMKPAAGVVAQSLDIKVPPPPFSEEDIFPCSECHDPEEINSERRELDIHEEEAKLKHDEENRWCLDCHDAKNRDFLHLANGELVPFEESYRLCGQCHGEKLRDWKAGVHGKRTGQWNGQKTYLLCAHCHNPHQPAFKKIQPLPAPVPPGQLTNSLKQKYKPVQLPTDPHLAAITVAKDSKTSPTEAK